nr:uncharacterized protein LOC122268714 [Parasteatoda tepidariorum]
MNFHSAKDTIASLIRPGKCHNAMFSNEDLLALDEVKPTRMANRKSASHQEEIPGSNRFGHECNCTQAFKSLRYYLRRVFLCGRETEKNNDETVIGYQTLKENIYFHSPNARKKTIKEELENRYSNLRKPLKNFNFLRQEV